jgi:MFS family permease
LTFGPIIAGKASDKFGRTKTIAFGAGVSIILNMIIGFFDVGVWGYAIMRIFIVVFSLLLALSSMVYPSEVLTPKYRSIGSMLVVATALGAGVLLVVLAAYFIRDWRTLHLVVSLVNLPSVFGKNIS